MNSFTETRKVIDTENLYCRLCVAVCLLAFIWGIPGNTTGHKLETTILMSLTKAC